jgi:hypothetical protein
MERIVKLSRSNDDWGIKFWQKCGVDSRFSAAWEMIGDFYKIRGKNGFQSRLQRDVENIKRA